MLNHSSAYKTLQADQTSPMRLLSMQSLGETSLYTKQSQPVDIVVVEDEPTVGRLLVHQLSLAGFTPWLAVDGYQAIELLTQQTPDLLILDWMLPGLDGLQVLSYVRGTMACEIPVLMISARTDEPDLVRSLEMGADDYLTKPFGLAELVARVRALLRRTVQRNGAHLNNVESSEMSQPLQVGSVVLHPDTHVATLDGQPLKLTRSEFYLLAYLMQHVGQTFSRAHLQETIWNQRHIPGDRSVDNVVLRLRKKLGSFSIYLESVWGVGYRLVVPCA